MTGGDITGVEFSRMAGTGRHITSYW